MSSPLQLKRGLLRRYTSRAKRRRLVAGSRLTPLGNRWWFVVGRLGRSFVRGPRRERGFTLLELLVVLGILALLIGLVGPAVLRQFGSAKEKIAHESVERLAGVLDLYKVDVGSYPSTEQGLRALIEKPAGVSDWHGPYLKGDTVPPDPWSHPYVYRNPSNRPGHDFDLCSLGPTGNGAEICNP